jgi:hypothetical protein
MARKTKMTIATLVTVLSLGGLTAFAMGVSQTGLGTSASSLSGDSAKAKVIRRKKVKIVQAKGSQAAATGSSYATPSYVSTGSSGSSTASAPRVESPSQRPSAVEPPDNSGQGGWDDDGGEQEGQDD